MSEKRAADEEMVQENNVTRQKVEMNIKGFKWSTIYDTRDKFYIKFPHAFLNAILDDDKVQPVNDLGFDMIKLEAILEYLGIRNKNLA